MYIQNISLNTESDKHFCSTQILPCLFNVTQSDYLLHIKTNRFANFKVYSSFWKSHPSCYLFFKNKHGSAVVLTYHTSTFTNYSPCITVVHHLAPLVYNTLLLIKSKIGTHDSFSSPLLWCCLCKFLVFKMAPHNLMKFIKLY